MIFNLKKIGENEILMLESDKLIFQSFENGQVASASCAKRQSRDIHPWKKKEDTEYSLGWVSLLGGEFLLPVATAYLKAEEPVAMIFDISSDHFGKLQKKKKERSEETPR